MLDNGCTLPPHNKRTKFEQLVCKGMGYCCPWKFLESHKNVRSTIIAVRLGVDRRTVSLWRDKPLSCANAAKCQKWRPIVEKTELNNPINLFLYYLSLGYDQDTAYQRTVTAAHMRENDKLHWPKNLVIKVVNP